MEIVEIKKIWEEVKAELKQTLPGSTFEPWIEPLEPIGFEEDKFTLLTGQSFAVGYLRVNCSKELRNAFYKVFNREIRYEIILDETLSKKLKDEQKKIQKQEEKTEQKKQEKSIDNLAYMRSTNLNLKYKFENFVVDKTNKIAYGSAQAVAEEPGARFNPLYIYGPSGVGKTHVMQAIGHYTIFNNSELKVRYLKTEDFINDYINSTAFRRDGSKSMAKFRQKYRDVDILLIDDIQFLESKTKTMEEVFNTFDTLYNKNKQIVMTSDRLPKDIPTLPERLRTRFEMGVIVEITPPEFETRIQILKNLAENSDIKVEKHVFDYIAKHYENNVRELEGAFNKVCLHADIEHCDLTLEFTKSVLRCEELIEKLSIEDIASEVANYYEIDVLELKSSARAKKISTTRALAAYLSRKILNVSYEQIAEYFNKKHTSILYSCEKIKEQLKNDNQLYEDAIAIKKRLDK